MEDKKDNSEINILDRYQLRDCIEDASFNLINIKKQIPKFIYIKKSVIHGEGAFAKKNILKGQFLGNYMGNISFIPLKDNGYIYKSKKNNKDIYIDALPKNKSNWTRYMNCSLNEKEENVIVIKLENEDSTLDGLILFYAKRNINLDEELLYDYGETYSQKLRNNIVL